MLGCAGPLFASPLPTAPGGQPACDLGPFRIRNQFPLNLHFLSFPGEDTKLMAARRWGVTVDLTTANVFSATPDLQAVHAAGGRRPLHREELDAVLAARPGRDQFLFDGEVTRAAVIVRYGLSERLEASLEVPFIDLGGGGLDGPIEGFHDTLGLGQAGRLGYPRNRLQIALALGGEPLLADATDATRGLGDLVVSAKALLRDELGRGPAVGLRAAAKPATGGSRSLLSSGHTDLGLNVILAKHYSRRAFYLNAGYVASGGWWAMPGVAIADAWTLLVAYEQWLGPGRSLVIQNLTHTSFLADATRSELADLSYEVTLGLKSRSASWLAWSVAFTENYATSKSSPDFGLHLGLTCTF